MAPHSSTIRRSLKRLHVLHRARLVERLQNIESISLTCDFWTNRNSKSFFVITGHFISTDFELKRTVLDFSHFPERHTADQIANTLRSKLQNLKILDRVVSVTCDGAKNLEKALPNAGVADRVWCLAHRLHLVIANGLGLWLSEKDKAKRSKKVFKKNVTEMTNKRRLDAGDPVEGETDGEDEQDEEDEDVSEGEDEALSSNADDDIEKNDDQEIDDNTDDENDLVS